MFRFRYQINNSMDDAIKHRGGLTAHIMMSRAHTTYRVVHQFPVQSR